MAEQNKQSHADQSWWFAQAGEYVLGTLPDDEHQVFHKILEHDFDAQMYVSAWLNHLQPVANGVQPINPPAEVWEDLATELNLTGKASHGAGAQTMMNNGAVTNEHTAMVATMQSGELMSGFTKSLFRARQWATVATLAAVTLAVLWGASLLDKTPKASSAEFDRVAVLSGADGDEAFIVDLASETNKIRVSSSEPNRLPEGKTYQVWGVHGGGTAALTLVDDQPHAWTISDVSASVQNLEAISISIEPAGGSTVSGPTGRVIYQGRIN
ncbi:MAG: anti-sigma factor [Gammaproteobacteria bacterium]|nr:anti-sigma factor [Gammaproteobacteria bacterium]